jgi:hypothetical protein
MLCRAWVGWGPDESCDRTLGGLGYSERRRAAGWRRVANAAGPAAITAAAASVPAEAAVG